jgi:HEAT repeat protein
LGVRPGVEDLVEGLASPSFNERKEAREGLLSLGAAAVPPLILATESENALLRWEAVNLLGTLGDLRATDAVLHVAMTDSEVHARWRANWAITNLDDGTVVPRLIAGLDDEDPTVAWNAAVTLSLFGTVEAVPFLHQGLDATDWRQWEAVNALGRVWNDETAPKLIVVLQEGPEDVRKEAALSLGRIGGEGALAALLEALSDDPSFEVRWRAAMMIGHIGDKETVTLLIEIRMKEAHPFVIEHINDAIEALMPQ